jgi:hypothetical protein
MMTTSSESIGYNFLFEIVSSMTPPTTSAFATVDQRVQVLRALERFRGRKVMQPQFGEGSVRLESLRSTTPLTKRPDVHDLVLELNQ